ncbi:hypothetical protein HYPSUDRAFT_196006 [Hypholoma sublateritium FD-334 SS-4]|uniref:Uncharacterized protein n=1 Tax=Hypholoma sublateritium (strain FD-334 SS-4) TaxID=945553 RepID=A0A0D2PN19_HYPSF|nr:hypothetical protein HYPSUDRAFT_196006 [Hypholoma sublateritium FD-334 SS-4]
MAPTLRSSSTNTTPTTTPTRKVPQCSQCKRARAGHPRSGCPFADSPQMSKMGAVDNSGHLTDALGSMLIGTPGPALDEDDDVKVAVRNRRRPSQPPLVRNETLLSLSTNSKEIVDRLSQPGAFDDDGDKHEVASKGARIVRWQEVVSAVVANSDPAKRTMKSKTPARSPMPGTLIPPSPDSSFMSSTSASFLKQESPSANSMRTPSEQPAPGPADSEEHALSSDDGATSEATVTRRRAAPLTRTMSAVERDVFVSRLSGEAPATIYIIPKADVDAIVKQAVSLKFITELVMSEDDDDPNALIILGREEKAVQTLLRKVETENRKAQVGKAKGSSTLRAAAGAAVVGAVGAWAGLAFT